MQMSCKLIEETHEKIKQKVLERIKTSEKENSSEHCANPEECATLKKEFFLDENSINVIFHFNQSFKHNHDFFELVYIYRGSCTNIVDQTTLHLGQGDLCLMNANAVHQLLGTTVDDIILNIVISKDLLNRAFAMLLAQDEVISNFFLNSIFQKNQQQNFIVFPAQYHGKTNSLLYLHNLIAENFTQNLYYQKLQESLLCSLFVELTREYQMFANYQSEQKLKNSNFSQILLYISENYRDATIQSIADHFNYNPAYISRMIKKVTGKNFLEIIHYFKIQEACSYLKNSTMTISEISNRIGYANVSHFYKLFQKQTGISLTEYRKQHV